MRTKRLMPALATVLATTGLANAAIRYLQA